MPRRLKPYLQQASIRPDAEVDVETYPFSIAAVREIGNIAFHPNVTFFVGENGSGKSTVLEAMALALGFGPEGGTRNVQISTVDSVSPLHKALRVARGVPVPRDATWRIDIPTAGIDLLLSFAAQTQATATQRLLSVDAFRRTCGNGQEAVAHEVHI
jgi:hypothetical protein